MYKFQLCIGRFYWIKNLITYNRWIEYKCISINSQKYVNSQKIYRLLINELCERKSEFPPMLDSHVAWIAM